MNTDVAYDLTPEMSPLADRLSETLAAGLIPRQYTDWSRRLLTRLQKPVQVVVIGLPGSGKSALVDMLLGDHVLGQGPSGGMVEITYGPRARAEIEGADGRVRVVEGTLAAERDALEDGPAILRMRQELPDARLRGMSVTEIALFGAPSRQTAILKQAVAYADILLLCSAEFTPAEQALWAEVPDEKKDHSFLVLTMADRRIMRGTLTEAIAALEEVAAQEFLGLYPLAAIQGLTAQVGRATGAGVDRQLWRSSGGKRLYDDLMHQIDQGRTSDLDQAEMLLRQFALLEENPRGAPVRQPEARIVTPGPRPSPSPAPSPVSTPVQAEVPRPVRPQNAPRTAPVPARESDLLAEAAAMIRDQAQRLMQDYDGAEAPDLNCIFDGTLSALREVLATVQPHAKTSDRMRAVEDAAREGEEVVMLCQLEQNEEAAVDAVTVLLQLRREITPS